MLSEAFFIVVVKVFLTFTIVWLNFVAEIQSFNVRANYFTIQILQQVQVGHEKMTSV